MYSSNQIKTLHLEPTTLCNAACPQCARYLDNGDENPLLPQETLSLEDIKTLLPSTFIQQLNKIFMCGTYGEPTVARDCLEIFKYVREVNPNLVVGMNTNGSTRTPSWWADVAKLFNNIYDYVVFSIDGLEDTNHIYRRNTQWHKIMQNAEAYINAGGSAHWDMLVFEHNEHQVEQARQLARDMGFTWFRVKVSQRYQYRNVQWIRGPKKAELQQIKDAAEFDCYAQRDKELYMSAHGLLMPCCYIAEQIYGPHLPERREQTLQCLGDLDQYHARHGIENVVKKFNKVTDTWTTEEPLKICMDFCSGKYQPRWKAQWRTDEQLR